MSYPCPDCGRPILGPHPNCPNAPRVLVPLIRGTTVRVRKCRWSSTWHRIQDRDQGRPHRHALPEILSSILREARPRNRRSVAGRLYRTEGDLMAGMGTGTPISFACPVAKRSKIHAVNNGYWNAIEERHVVHRTGRTRPNYSSHRTQRTLPKQHEFVCSCGHRGWSRISSILRYPIL